MSYPRSCRICGDLHNGQLFHETLCNRCREGESELRGRRIHLPPPRRVLSKASHYHPGQTVEMTERTVVEHDTFIKFSRATVTGVNEDGRVWVRYLDPPKRANVFRPELIGNAEYNLLRVVEVATIPA